VLFTAAILSLSLVGGVAWYLQPAPLPAPVWADDYDVNAKPPELIAPGTVVGNGPPEGWTHLVIKSLPRVRPGHETRIPALTRSQTVRMTRWMFTAFAADVRPETRGNETRYHLRAIGLGLGTAVDGRDVIITAETAAKYGVKLDWITKTIITKGYETQALAVVAVHSPGFAVLDTPVWFRCGEKNRLIRLRYALLVDTAVGGLDVLGWVLDPDKECSDSTRAVLLNENQIDEAELVPDSKEFDVLGISHEATFGIDRLPAHRRNVSLPQELQEVVVKTRFTPEDAKKLEAGLRRLLTP
jgi:hypothetical protein